MSCAKAALKFSEVEKTEKSKSKMGGIISRFRKTPTLEAQLEAIDKKIFQIHEFNENTEHAMKRIIACMLFYGWILIAVGGVIAYFYWDHETWDTALMCFAPLALMPLILLGSKRLLQLYFTSRIERKNLELKCLIKEKKQLLDKVKETETYKKAQEILEKFDPDVRMRKAQQEHNKMMAAVMMQTQEVRRRPVGTPVGGPNKNMGMQSRPDGQFTPLRQNQMQGVANNMPVAMRTPYVPQTARPILSRDRSHVEKMIDFLVGEGPNNRYALVCKKCFSHNGMALKEEFEYLSYKCCYCYNFNPARKQRPDLPKQLSQSMQSLTDISRSNSPAPADASSMKDPDNEADCPPAQRSLSSCDRPAPEGNELPSEEVAPPNALFTETTTETPADVSLHQE